MPFVVLEERGNTSHYTVAGAEVSIGRAPSNTIMVTDEKASRNHCVLVQQPDRSWVLRDLKSRNGTYLRGEPVLEVQLNFGDTFQIGNSKLSLYSEESSAFETKNALEPIHEFTLPQAPREAVGVNEAFASFAKAASEDTPKSILESTAQFVGRLLPGVRVAVASANHEGTAKAVAFFNFISGSPNAELPANFGATAGKLLGPRSRTQVKPRSGDHPACIYVPLKCGDRAAGVLYVERESKEVELNETQVQLIENAANIAALMLGAAKSRLTEEELRARLQTFESEMDGLRKELEAKLDMQTAELTALRMEAEGREGPSWHHD